MHSIFANFEMICEEREKNIGRKKYNSYSDNYEIFFQVDSLPRIIDFSVKLSKE